MADEEKESKPLPFPPAIRNAIDTGKEFFFSVSKGVRFTVGFVAIAMVVIGAALVYKQVNEPYAVLFTGLDQEDASSIMTKLKEQKVPYRVNGATIEVPEKSVHELRLDMAGAGLPRGGGVGFEAFDKMRMGATEFEQRVTFRRAMEGELARTIGTVSAVQNARVHLVLPEKSVFTSRREPASASVVLKLRQGRTLDGSEVQGIVHLVSSAVPGLTPGNITLVSTDGQMLHKPRGGDESGFDPDQISVARAMESSLEERSRTMLEKILGPGHVDVRVSAEMDNAKTERTADHFDPQKTAVRSEETSSEKQIDGDDISVAGVPGAESNLPTGTAPVDDAAGAGAQVTTTREAATRNYEIDRVTEKRVNTAPTLKRLTVAVVVDGKKVDAGIVERSREELDKLKGLVAGAVGIDEKRGDVLTVESVPFLGSMAEHEAEIAAAAEPKGLLSFVPEKYRKYVPFAGAGLLALAIIGVAARMRANRKKQAPVRVVKPLTVATPELQAAVAAAAALPPAERDAAVAALGAAHATHLDREEAVRRAHSDPATAALVLKHWLGTFDEKAQLPVAAAPAA